MKHCWTGRAARAVLAGVTVVTICIPATDALLCSMNAGQMREMWADHRATTQPTMDARNVHICAFMTCCQTRAPAARVPAVPFALATVLAARETSPVLLQQHHTTFLPTESPPPRA